MTITIDSTNPRSVAALELMTQAGQWGKAHLRDGQKFYAVPSRTQPNVRYLTDTHSCTCPDHKWRGVDCAHILAVRLHVARVTGRQPRRPRRDDCGPTSSCQPDGRVCPRHLHRAERQLDPRRVAALSAEYESLFPSE